MQIFVAFSAEDWVILRSLGLPATISTGLDQLRGDQARRLCDHTVSHPLQPAAITTDGYQLLLMGASLALPKHQFPEGLSILVSHLLQIEDAYGFDVGERVEVWPMDPPEHESIFAATRFRDSALARRCIWESAEYSLPADGFLEHIRTQAANDYPAKRRDLLRILEKARKPGRLVGASEIAARLEAFRCTFDLDVVEALLKDAMSTADSLERCLFLAAAELMGLWYQSLEVVRTAQIQGGLSEDHVPHPRDIRDQLCVVDSFVKLHKELLKRQTKKPSYKP